MAIYIIKKFGVLLKKLIKACALDTNYEALLINRDKEVFYDKYINEFSGISRF